MDNPYDDVVRENMEAIERSEREIEEDNWVDDEDDSLNEDEENL